MPELAYWLQLLTYLLAISVVILLTIVVWVLFFGAILNQRRYEQARQAHEVQKARVEQTIGQVMSTMRARTDDYFSRSRR